MPAINFYHDTIYAMNSSLDAIITGMPVQDAKEIVAEINNEVIKTEMLLSCYNPLSETYQVNAMAYRNKVRVSEELWSILEETSQFHQQTDGYFHVGLGKFKNGLLGNHSKDAALNVELDSADHSVRFTSGVVSLDFGAIGKGIVLRKVDKILTRFGAEHCFISFGGSSILTRGHHPYGNNWPVSMRDETPDGVVFYLNNCCISISCALQKTTNVEKYHVVNPKSLQPEENNRQVVVQSSCPVLAELLSTVLIMTTPADTGKIVNRLNPERAIVFESKPDKRNSIQFSYGQIH